MIRYVRTGFFATRPTHANTRTAPVQSTRVNTIGSMIIASPGPYGGVSTAIAIARTINTPIIAAKTVSGPAHQSFFKFTRAVGIIAPISWELGLVAQLFFHQNNCNAPGNDLAVDD